MTDNNLEPVTSLSSDLSTQENLTIQLEELLVAGNYDEAKLLLEPSQPVNIAGIGISIVKEK
jgi:magnesium transporter